MPQPGSAPDYTLLITQLKALSEGVSYPVTVLANASALIYDALPDLNWAGFYLLRDERLALGPFQGRVACTSIAPGRGVCGTALVTNETQLVPDVHKFPGHIACDSASASEIVVPIRIGGAVWGVLDIDSPLPDRFTENDRAGLEGFTAALEEILTPIVKNE